MARAALLASFMFLFAIPAFANTSVYGKVTGVDDNPMSHAMVILTRPSDNRPVEEVSADKSGNYQITIGKEGLWALHFVGTFHHSYDVALYVNSRKAIQLNVRLTTYNYENNLSRAAIIGNFNDWSIYNAIRMKEHRNGLFSAMIRSTSDTLIYKLVNVRTGGLVEGTDADGYMLSGINGYSSFLISGKRDVRVTFDPRMLRSSSKRPYFKIKAPDPFESRFSDAFAVYQNTKYVYDSSLYRHIADFQMARFRYNFNPAIDSVKKLMEHEGNKLIRQVLQLDYCGLKAMNTYKRYLDVGVSRKTLKDIPPGSVIWSLDPEVMWMALDHGAYRTRIRKRYIQSVLSTNPMQRTKEYLLGKEIDRCFHSLKYNRIPEYLNILLDQYGDSPEARLEKRIYSGNYIHIKKGAEAPKFAVRSLSDSSAFYTDSTFAGKYYLVVFWSPSNRSSVDEMELLSRLLPKHEGKNLRVVAVSVGRSARVAARFIQVHHFEDSWLNAVDPRGIGSKLCKEFEVYSIPKAVLINPQGIIAAAGWSLRGTGVEKVLKETPVASK